MTEETQIKTSKLPKIVQMKKIKVLHNPELLKSLKNSLYKEDVLYESKPGDFLKLDRSVTLLNKLNLITNSSLTVAMYEKGTLVEKTSENVARLIGQSNYDTLLSALCSVFSQELKIRGILSVLTEPSKRTTTSVQTENQQPVKNNVEDKACQTEETSIGLFTKEKPKRNKVKRLTPYVVTENSKRPIKKIVIDPNNFQCYSRKKAEPELIKDMESPVSMQDENSRESLALSVNTWEPLMDDPMGLIQKIQNVTQSPKQQVDWSTGTQFQMLDGTVIKLPFKIEDQFHIVTPETLKYIPRELRIKVLWYQAHIDWKFCLTRDDKNYLPIHVAAMNGDVGMLRRHCVVLKARQESVDVSTGGNMTALQIAILRDNPLCTSMLLHFGADPLICDDEYRNCFHLAAESSPEHLNALILHCETNPLKVLQDNEELWTEDLASKPKEYLAKYLLEKISTMSDNQGYTPLMRASMEGQYENVKTLLEAVPDTVNGQMPNSGNTALFMAVSAACQDCNNRGNQSIVADNFRKTIELLVENGAEPAIDNHSGVNVNSLLTDFKVGDLSMIIANKMTIMNCTETVPAGSNKTDNVMILKSPDGTLNVKEIKAKRDTRECKPVILDNIKIEFGNAQIKPTLKMAVKTEKVNQPTKDAAQCKIVPNMYLNSFKSFVQNRFGDRPVDESKVSKEAPTGIQITSAGALVNARPLKVNNVAQHLRDSIKVSTATMKPAAGVPVASSALNKVNFLQEPSKMSTLKILKTVPIKVEVKIPTGNREVVKRKRTSTPGISQATSNSDATEGGTLKKSKLFP